MRGGEPSSSGGEVERAAGWVVVVEVSREVSVRMSSAAFDGKEGSMGSAAIRVSGNSSSKRWIMRWRVESRNCRRPVIEHALVYALSRWREQLDKD